MIEILNLIRSWKNFTATTNAKSRLVKMLNGDEALISHYLRLLDRIPFLTWESTVTKPDLNDGWDKFLSYFGPRAESTVVFKGPVVEIPPGHPGLCHKASYELLKQTPGAVFYSGFCLTDESSCSHDWHWHSFLVKDGVILESTHVVRSRYTGIPVEHPEQIYDMESFQLAT